ncbi:DNA replication factor C, large subunit [Piromyces finnis]|uniref:Replication factor C subunit 1 n=1 Tax=Piromyces finnis TaxID=1754191 RepID=A0A1Y1V6P0_9FUNG|nr:DNA replication factor C, large subunit [Piromyces finnis]|eukprot:ORX47885.1 DNA replication factor C, large subunit [Piromyces finnis]
MDIRNYFNPLANRKNAKRKKENEQTKKEDGDNLNKRMKVIDPSTYFAKKSNSENEKQKRKILNEADDNTSFENINIKKSKGKQILDSNDDEMAVAENNNRTKKKISSSKVKSMEINKKEEKELDLPIKKRTKSELQDNEELEHKSELQSKKIEDELIEEEKPKKKFNYRAYLAKKSAGPKAPGSKIIPKGKENCLLGMTFVFTGDLSSISRDEATDLVKRYGGRVTGAPSSRTTYLVVGEDPGESKLAKAKKHKIKQINEDELLDLIGSSLNKNDITSSNDIKSNNNDSDLMLIKESVKKPIENSEKSRPSFNNKSSIHINENSNKIEKMNIDDKEYKSNDTLLWVDKYKPKDVSEIIGHKTNIDKIRSWLKDWKSGAIFKKDSPKALLLSGPPGIGKTTAAILCSEAEGFKPIEFNASDARSKNILKNTLSDLIGNHTMTEYLDKNLKKKQINNDIKNVIIMDEVDGMSSGDRGGNAELIQMIKKTKTPIICICNDRQSPKIRTLANYTLDLRFRRPDASAIMKRIGPICQKEGLRFQQNSIEQIIQSTQSDIRQVLNALATYRLNATSISYDDSKLLAKKSEKDFSQNPFSLVQKFFNLSEYRNSTFADRMDYFFEDYELMPLMIQENYLQISPVLAKNERGRPDSVKLLNLMSEASDSIAYGDIINNTLRRTNNWSLLSVQGSFSCARPSYFVHGMAHGQYNFPGWLGQNSKAGKYKRCLHEIYSHSCQKISSNISEFRQEYIPSLTNSLLTPLLEKGADGISDVIEEMDSYYISKEDFDMIMELGVGDKSGEKLLKKVDTNIKRTFTRLYNKENHPTSFIAPIAVKKNVKTEKVIPDAEEIVDNEENGDENEDENEDDILNDKILNAAGVKNKTKSKAKSTKASTRKASASSTTKKRTTTRRKK